MIREAYRIGRGLGIGRRLRERRRLCGGSHGRLFVGRDKKERTQADHDADEPRDRAVDDRYLDAVLLLAVADRVIRRNVPV